MRVQNRRCVMSNAHPEPKTRTALEPRVGRTLIARLDERVLVPARAAGYDLPVLGATPRPRGVELVQIGSSPWLLADPFDDPTTRRTRGRLVIPGEARERLVSLVRAGVEPDVLHIAHELPPGTRLEDVRHLPRPVDPKRRERDAHLAAGLRRAVKAAAIGAGVAVGFVALAPAALAAAASGLDPILLGGVLSADGEYVAWSELARWDV